MYKKLTNKQLYSVLIEAISMESLTIPTNKRQFKDIQNTIKEIKYEMAARIDYQKEELNTINIFNKFYGTPEDKEIISFRDSKYDFEFIATDN